MNLIVLGTPPPPCYPELVGACIWTIYSDTDTLEVVNEQFIGGWPLSSRWSILGSACPMKKLNEPYKGPETERCRLRALTKHVDKLGPYKRKKCVSPWNPDGVKKGSAQVLWRVFRTSVPNMFNEGFDQRHLNFMTQFFGIELLQNNKARLHFHFCKWQHPTLVTHPRKGKAELNIIDFLWLWITILILILVL